MKWNEAEMVALVGRRAADWEGKLTYRWVWFNSKQFILFLQNRISSTLGVVHILRNHGSLQMITVLHRGGSSQMITILHRGGPPNDYSIT